MKGYIESFNDNRLFGFIGGEDGQRYFFHLHDVTLDQLLRQISTARSIGMPVSFEVGSPDERPAFSEVNSRLRCAHASGVTPLAADDAQVASYRETSVIRSWNTAKGLGFLIRPCGDELGFTRDSIITEGEETLRPGSLVYHGVAPRTSKWSTEIRQSSRPVIDVRRHVTVTDLEIVDAPAVEFPSAAAAYQRVKSRGVVVSYDPTKFGFVRPDDSDEDVFFAAGAVGYTPEERQSIAPGMTVEFILCQGADDSLLRKLNNDYRRGHISEEQYQTKIGSVEGRTHAENVRPVDLSVQLVDDSWLPKDVKVVPQEAVSFPTKSILLTDRFKGVPLRKIGIRRRKIA